MDLRMAPADHYDKAFELLGNVELLGNTVSDPGHALLAALIHTQLGLLKHQMDRRT